MAKQKHHFGGKMSDKIATNSKKYVRNVIGICVINRSKIYDKQSISATVSIGIC